MLEALLGEQHKRKLRLRTKTNDQLFELYEGQLFLKHRSKDALEESKRVLKHFKAYLGEYPPSAELGIAFLGQFQEVKSRTLYRYNAILKGFLEWTGEEFRHKIRVPDSLPDYIEDDDLEKLRAAMASKKTHKGVIERNLLIIDLGCMTGLRRSEIANLVVQDINFDRQYLCVRLGKGQKDRIVDLVPSLCERLRVFTKGMDPEDPVFGLAPETISGLISWAAKKAGVNLHTHSLRHFFGERLVDTGADLEVIRRLMGHANLNTTRRYLGRTDQQRREAINRLEKGTTDDIADPQSKMEDILRQKIRLYKPDSVIGEAYRLLLYQLTKAR